MDRRGTTRIALALALIAAGGALVIVAPSVHRALWIARLALRETSLILLPVAAASVILVRGRRDRAARLCRLLSMVAALVALVAFVAPLTALPRVTDFSPADYVLGALRTPRVRVDPDVVRGTESLELYLGGTPARAAETYRLATPMSWVDRPVPPTLLVHGGGDQPVSPVHSRRLARALADRGRDVTFVEVPMGEHGMDARPGGTGEQVTLRAVLDFLGPRLACRP